MAEKDAYFEALMRYYAHKDDDAQGNVSVAPFLFQDGSGSFLLELRIKKPDGFYVVKNLLGFRDNVRTGRVHTYGKNFSFAHVLKSFSAQNRAFIGLLLTLLDEYAFYRAHFSPENKKTSLRLLPVTQKNVERVLSACIGSEVGYGTSPDDAVLYPVRRENPPIDFRIVRENHRILLIPSRTDYRIFGRFVLTDRVFYQADDTYYKLASPPLLLIGKSEDKQLVISETEASRFASLAVDSLKKNGLATTDERFDASVVDTPLSTTVYIEGDTQKLVARVEFRYGDTVFSPYTKSATTLAVFRDREAEKKVLSRLSEAGFFKHGAKIVMQNSEKIFDFLSEGTARLSDCATVLYESGFLKMTPIHAGSASVGVRLSPERLLSISVQADGVPAEETYDFIRSLHLKKRFHRIKDGTFYRLDTPQMLSLSEFFDRLGVKPSDLVDSTVTLRGEHAFHVGALLKDARFSVSADEAFQKINDAFENAAKDATKRTVPASLCSTLRPYQVQAFHWLTVHTDAGLGGILADDMGLGKTLEVLTLILASKETHPAPALIVVPTSLIYNWTSECEKFTPTLKARAVIGSGAERKALLSDLTGVDLVITSYDTLRRDFPYYSPHTFSFLILDEAQYIKNANTQKARTIKTLHADVRFALTGTPIENSLSELWSIFDFLLPGYLRTYSQFKKRYELPIVKQKSEQKLRELNQKIAPFLLRRVKEQVLTELPDKTERTVLCPLSAEQQTLYDAYFRSARRDFLEEIEAKGFDKSRFLLLSLLMRLRQLCCHPSLFVEGYTGGSGKYDVALELIVESLASGHTVLLFSQFTAMLDLLAEGLDELALEYFYLRGSTPSGERTQMAKSFNQGEKPIFLCSLKAGGTGLNLTGADTVIHFDPWWNPAVEAQATDRAYRIGQTRGVQVCKLISAGTIEERVEKFKALKSQLAETVLSDDPAFVGSLSKEMAYRLFEIEDEKA